MYGSKSYFQDYYDNDREEFPEVYGYLDDDILDEIDW
jgi:hypothetical protein